MSNMRTDAFFVNEQKLPSIIRGNVRIDWVNLGEGFDGDYDADNPDDVNLLRFDVYRHDGAEWIEVEDGSYCTQVPAHANHVTLRQILSIFMDYIHDDIKSVGKSKRKCEQLSWTDLDGNIQINAMDDVFN
jgi:hypothetical protein